MLHKDPNAHAPSKTAECRACGGVVSKKASTCPHCGQKRPYKAKTSVGTWVVIVIAGFLTLSIINDSASSGNGSSSAPVKSSSHSDYSNPSKQQDWIWASQDGIKNRLKDPGSAKFKDSFFVLWKGTPVVCGYVNSKNAMGGYGGFQRFIASGDVIAYLEEQVSDFNNVWREICTQ
ncbi:hypothetical protein A11S_858 [Micavibrio aeruginosavorus EPB]|uniref:Uncharacterized protein n=2 Tax=Micavibrio aeruginosavorus TaxID=349221 RepID=M4VI04_9BACT|nr:hypothetical protein A11S_858 [Micavibrio aeruginosavorus EPB]